MRAYIYKIINEKTDDIYIGSTNNLKNRFKSHKSNARLNKDGKLYDCMREYGALLRHLPPLSSKIVTKSCDAKWEAVEITNKEIQAAVYNALLEDYKTHITYQCKADWQDMDENEFLNVMLAYKFFNNTQKFK